MSIAAVLPPPSSSSLQRRLPRLTARARRLLSATNLHLAGVAALAILVVYLLAHLLLLVQGVKALGPEAIAAQRRLLATAEGQAAPLRGLDGKLEDSDAAASDLYAKRLPYAYSEVLAELGALTSRQKVRLARVQYAQRPVLTGEYALTEVLMDASVSGEYRAVMQFLNSLERDRMMFLISGINLTGQQTGQVNLRVRLTTYLRSPSTTEAAAVLSSEASAEATPALSQNDNETSTPLGRPVSGRGAR